MSHIETLTSDNAIDLLRRAAREGFEGTISCLVHAKWQVLDIRVEGVADQDLRIRLMTSPPEGVELLKDQPVGICLQHEYHKYVFESTIAEDYGPVSDKILTIDTPDKIEMMQRRAYERQSIPTGLHVRAMFWHLGYPEETSQQPCEDYWQGQLENLSAGGAMICVEPGLQSCFSIGQLVGVQFTPMSYQKPLLLEGRVRHLKSPAPQDRLQVGVEFLGLEATAEGRDILHRLLDVIEAYEKMNKNNTFPS